MEDKLPTKESHVWTLSDFIERRKDWDQGDEIRLAEYLQQLSNKISQGSIDTLNDLNDLVSSVDDTAIKIANINNEFQLLADKQFIENRVQEEDETVQIIVEKPIAINEIHDDDLAVINLKETLKNSFQAIDSHFEKITVVVSDSDDDDDEPNHEETVLRPRSFYKKLNLPSLSGNIQCEIDIDNTMSSDSGSDVQQSPNAFKDEKSFSNDVQEEEIHSISESQFIHEHNSSSIDTYSNNIQTNKFKPKDNTTNANNIEDDLFSPPPLLNDNDEDDLDNEYNIFGNSSNMYGEKNLWDDDDDDDDDFSNQPPLPIYSDELPKQEIKSNIQEKVAIPSIQQSLNAELQKRFQKDNNSLDNVNEESTKIKLPKEAINNFEGIDTKLNNASSAHEIKQSTTSQINTNLTEISQDSNVEIINKDYNISNDVFDKTIHNQKDLNLNKETRPSKIRSFFEQDSDDEDLFSKKTPNVIPVLKPKISIQKENLIKNIISSKSIFSESDSDEEIIKKESNTIEKVPPSISNNDSRNILNSSSDDDLFNIKSNKNKCIIKPDSSFISSTGHKVLNETKSKDIKDKNVKDLLNKENVDEFNINPEEFGGITDNRIMKNDSLSNNIEYSQNINKTMIQSNEKSLNFQQSKKLNNLFSSDEDDLDDNTYINDSDSNTNYIKNDQTISNMNKVEHHINDELKSDKKVEIFDSSSDDDIFNVNKLNNSSVSIKNSKQSNVQEIKIIESKSNDNCAIIDQEKSIVIADKKNVTGNSNIFSLLSDDDDDDDYYLSINTSNTQTINKNIQTTSSSSKEFLNLKMDTKNDNFQNLSSENLLNKNQNSIKEKNIDIIKSETLINYKDNTIKSIFSNDPNMDSNINSKATSITSDLNKTSKTFVKDTVDGSSFSLSNSKIETPIKLPGKLNKNAGAFINIAGLLPNSKNSLKKIDIPQSTSLAENNDFISSIVTDDLPNSKCLQEKPDIIRSVSLDENNDHLPTSGTKLFSVEKERVKIKVKRRPQSRRARIAAARMSSVDIDQDSNIQEHSRLFGSTSDLVDNHASQILNDSIVNSSKDIEKEIVIPSGNKLNSTHNDEIYESSKGLEINKEVKKNVLNLFDEDSDISHNDEIYESNKGLEINKEVKKNVLNLFDEDSDIFESTEEETNKTYGSDNIKENILDEKLVETKLAHEKVPDIVSVHEHDPKIESTYNKYINDKQREIKLKSEEQVETESVHKTIPEIQSICNENVLALDINMTNKNLSKPTVQNTKLSKESNSLFDDDEDDIFSSKTVKIKVTSSNIFDSDDEFDFNKKSTKKKSIKSIFGDESDDDDLFSTSSNPTSNLPSKKSPIDKLSQQPNRINAEGYVKLAAESVAVNPLENKKS